MENPHPARGGTLASKRQNFNKKQFIQYEPHLVEEMNEKKSGNQSVSGRLLTLIYKRMVFWSRYAKHQYNGRRYFWKSIPELSEELQYSEKQVSRGLKALVELGMIFREKLNKRNWKHTYYYYLPHSVHTKEVPRISTSNPTSRSTSCSGSDADGGIRPLVQATPLASASTASEEHLEGAGASPRATGAPASGVTGASPASTASEEHLEGAGASPRATGAFCHSVPVYPTTCQEDRSSQNRRTIPPKMSASISIKNNPLLEKQLRQIAEKCLDYSINPPKPLTRAGVGFAT